MTVGPQQFWLGISRVGQQVRFWIDTTTVHLSIGGWRIKTVPSRLSAVDLARLRHNGARPAGPSPAGNAPGVLAASRCVEVQRLVNSAGIITLGNHVVQSAPRWPGSEPASAWTARSCMSLPGRHLVAHPALPHPARPAPQAPRRPPGRPRATSSPRLTIKLKVSSRSGIQVARQASRSVTPPCGSSISTVS